MDDCAFKKKKLNPCWVKVHNSHKKLKKSEYIVALINIFISLKSLYPFAN
jgi:hypothetical protein